MSIDYSPPDEVEDIEIRRELFALREEHRALDEAINEYFEKNPGDQITLGRLKRQKLQLKDKIKFFEDQLRPDIIA